MLNAKELARLLNANVHPKLFTSWLVMSPNATLLAYSGDLNIQQRRDQAALLSQIWKEHRDKLREQQHEPSNSHDQLSSSASTASTIVEGALETLTIENARSNIIIRAVQPRLLLVLVGGAPPHRAADFFKITAEARGDPRYPAESASADVASNGSATPTPPPSEANKQSDDDTEVTPPGTIEESDLTDREKTQMLTIQREKIDAATEYMRGDFSSRTFVMPDELAIP